MTGRTWTNWGRTSRSTPARVVRPRSAEAVARALRDASADGLAVRPVGAAHSFTALARTEGVLLETTGLAGLRSIDRDRGRITVGGGTTIAAVARIAGRFGLAFQNLGDIDHQTIAGAIGTGTHGTGGAFGPIASQVVGLRLVTPAGEVLDLGEDDPLLLAARVSLGALGVVTAVTLQLAPAFGLAADERAEPLRPVVEGFADRVAAADHFEFYWFPGTELALTKTNTRIPLDEVGPQGSRLQRLIDDEVLANGLFELTCRLGRRAPLLVPTINRIASRTVAERSYAAPSHAVFTSPRRVRFAETEWGVPLEALPEAFEAFRSAVRRSGLRISFPVEVRAVAADESAWLSTSYARPTAYIAAHCYHRDVRREYLRIAERVFRGFDGRPHWGKLHTRDAADLRGRYPRFDDFLAVRRRLDPGGLLRNPHLDRVLGLP
ncbi:D-arabinono-1,4-lactone oxidase [Amnibacterium kyonggiense]|uniref:FAD-linked oxidoreductase n=1 Tax=Amnibacterium kyonggiense TaxID=595671 RepID=A0A4R7FRN2_9MICO|nr:D-arabinono-1,4-lactone oxidase [Amnibacterium kyonggiense]TDS80477.1 FAD-linked oxidoreductase [Amnibacterium kyonggiense]